MMPSSLTHHRTETYHSGRLSTGGAPTYVDIPDWPPTPPPIRSRNTGNGGCQSPPACLSRQRYAAGKV